MNNYDIRATADAFGTTINNGLESIGDGAAQFGSNMKDGAASLAAKYGGEVGEIVGSNISTPLIGIDATQVPAMKSAIKTYVDDLSTHLDGINTSLETDTAFKGTYATSITEYVEGVTYACKGIVSNLLAFYDELTRVEQAFNEKVEGLSSSISGSAEAVRASEVHYQVGE